MPRPVSSKTLRRARLALLAVAALLLVPIAVYISTFGITVSANHTRWSEMGSAMAGIYAPILALLTLVVLLIQVQLQGRLNEHTFDQSFVQDARADLHFYLEQLVRELSLEFAQGISIQAALVAALAYASETDLKQPQAVQAAKALHERSFRLVTMWSAVYGVLAGLKANDYPPYSNNYVTAKHKAIAMLSYACCAGLDNLVWINSEGRLAYPYEFSSAPPSHRRAV